MIVYDDVCWWLWWCLLMIMMMNIYVCIYIDGEFLHVKWRWYLWWSHVWKWRRKWWRFVWWTYSLLSHMLIHSWVGFYIQWRWLWYLFSMKTTRIFSIQMLTIMIHLYLELTTLMTTWYHMHIELCMGT